MALLQRALYPLKVWLLVTKAFFPVHRLYLKIKLGLQESFH